MPSPTDFPAAGRVIAVNDDSVVFAPLNTNYEWKLLTAGRYDGPVNQRIECFIRVRGRKVYTVPSGGNFVQPIFGPPRIVQGRVKYLDERTVVVQAGAPIIVDLPTDESAYDLANGHLGPAALVNVVALPGAGFELATAAVAR